MPVRLVEVVEALPNRAPYSPMDSTCSRAKEAAEVALLYVKGVTVKTLAGTYLDIILGNIDM